MPDTLSYRLELYLTREGEAPSHLPNLTWFGTEPRLGFAAKVADCTRKALAVLTEGDKRHARLQIEVRTEGAG